MIVKLKESIVLRMEPMGGKCFDKMNGNIIEVDKELFFLLHKMDKLGALVVLEEQNNEKVKQCIQKLLKLGIIEKLPNGLLSEHYWKKEAEYQATVMKKRNYMVPETIHYAITFRCMNHCKDCYMRKHETIYNEEMSLEEIKNILTDIKNAGVFQLAIGGGEPFQKENLESILKIAYELGFVIHITTGKYSLSDMELEMIKKYVSILQIGLRVSQNGELEEKESLKKLTENLKKNKIIFGANFILNRTGIQNFTKILSNINDYQFYSTTLIRYKPPMNKKRWEEEAPTYEDWIHLESILKNIDLKSNMQVRFDCALSHLARENVDIAKENGYHGCVAGSLMLSMAPDGSLFPCSQLVGKEFYIGNLKNEKFIDILKENTTLKKYCRFRDTSSYCSSICGQCKFSKFCGSCRALASDGMNEGILCHDPVLSENQETMLESYLDVCDVAGTTSNGIPYYTYEQYMNSYLTNYPERLMKKNENN